LKKPNSPPPLLGHRSLQVVLEQVAIWIIGFTA
jgi:hypothetical protein